MKTRTSVVIGMIVAVILQGNSQTLALSCSFPLFSKSYEKHDLLLHGKLIEKNIVLFWENQKLTDLTFETINVYKGEINETFLIKANLSWDDHYVEGEEYVLFEARMKTAIFEVIVFQITLHLHP